MEQDYTRTASVSGRTIERGGTVNGCSSGAVVRVSIVKVVAAHDAGEVCSAGESVAASITRASTASIRACATIVLWCELVKGAWMTSILDALLAGVH